MNSNVHRGERSVACFFLTSSTHCFLLITRKILIKACLTHTFIDKRSETSVGRWMGNILLPCIAVCGSIYMCVFYVYYPECARNILWSRLLKTGNGCLGNHILDMLDEEWLRIRRPKEGNLDLHAPAWLIAVKERMLELIQTKLLKSTH